MKKYLILIIMVASLILAFLPAYAEGSVTVSDRTIFLFVNNGQLGMWERISYENPNGESVKIVVPKEAENIQGGTAKGALSLKPEDMKQTPDGLELNIPIPQGNDLVELSYNVKPNENLFDFAIKLSNAPKKMLFMSGGDVAVSGPQIGQGVPKKSGDMKLVEFPVNATLKEGDIILAQMDIYPGSLNPQQSQQNGGQQQNAGQQQGENVDQNESKLATPYSTQFHNPGHIRLWNTSVFKRIDPHVFTALMVLLPLTLIIFYLRKRQQDKLLETVDVEELAFQKLYNKQQDIITKIADLDEKYENGQIEEEEYTTLRENYKHRALQIKAHLMKLSE